ncbi:MAG: hypothetical protein QOJ29_728 [Thermoleophilaceae bacterium]|jgi:hypothetical protein|nr:hypothetical protein [Thermoleophilaceae bacterium]
MVSTPPSGSRRQTVIRWVVTGLATLWAAVGIMLPPFGCAIGEYEENNPSCDTPTLQIIGLGVLVAGVVAARVTRRPAAQWLGIAISSVLVLIGLDDI